MEFCELSALEIGKLISKGEVSSFDVVSYFLNRIKNYDKFYNSFITLLEEDALTSAKEIDAKIKEGKILSPFAGVPIAIKDNIAVKDLPLTCGSKFLKDYISTYDATAVKKLKEAGLIIIGKTNMDEFAMGSSGENSYFGKTFNPWNIERVAGGSSSGSAVAVSCGFAPLALGSDTGGSVRQPASFCSVCGFKGSYGGVSRFGLTAFASSLDQIGIFAKDVKDITTLYEIISGKDKMDATSISYFTDKQINLSSDLSNLKIGLPKEFFGGNLDEEVKEKINDVVEIFKNLGAEIEYFNLPHHKFSVPTYYVISSAESSSNLSRFDGVRYGEKIEEDNIYVNSRVNGFGREVKRRIMTGTFVLSEGYYNEYYIKANKVRDIIKEEYKNAFKKYDVILGPTSPTKPFKIGEKFGKTVDMYMSDFYTVPANLCNIPAISVPCGFTEDNLPVGLQLFSNYLEDEKLLSIANLYLEKTDFAKKNPILIED